MDQSVNPFLDTREKYQEIYSNIKDYEHQIEAIKRDLESKTKMLVESRINYKKALEQKAEQLKSSCTHKNADGNYANDKTHDSIIVPIEGGYVKHSFCAICGVKFKSGEVVIPKEELEKKIKADLEKSAIETGNYYLEDDDNFVETMEFDPNFLTQNFLDVTKDYFK